MRQSYLRQFLHTLTQQVREQGLTGFHFSVGMLNTPLANLLNSLFKSAIERAREGSDVLCDPEVVGILEYYEREYPHNVNVLVAERYMLGLLLDCLIIEECERDPSKCRPFIEDFERLTFEEHLLLAQGIPVPVARERSLVCI